MIEEQKNHKDMIIDFDELGLDDLIEEDLKKEKKKSELSDEMKKKLDQQDLNKFGDALEKSTFQQKISSTNNKEGSFISDLITNTSNLQKEQKENSTLDQQNKINKQIEQHNTHTNTEQHFQDVKQTNNNTVNNNNTTIIQEQQSKEQPQQNTTIQQNITNIENNQNTQNNQNNQNTQHVQDKQEDKQVGNETKEEPKNEKETVIIQNTEKTQETNTTVTNTNTNTNTNEIGTAIEEKREKIEGGSEINVKPTGAYSKEVADNSALFTQEKELQQLQENKQIQNKIDKEGNEIKKEETAENNVTVKIETPTTQQQTPTQTTSPSQQQTSEIGNDKIQQELEEKKEQEQNKEDTHSIQDVMNNEKKQDLPKQQETKKENREEKIEQQNEQKNDEDLGKSKVQNNIGKGRKIAVNTLDDLSNIEETIEKEKNRLGKRGEYTNKDLENIKRTMGEGSQFTKLIDGIDKKIVGGPLSNELRDKYIEESTQGQLFGNLEEVKREYEKRQTKERGNFVMKKISGIEDTNINEYQMYETIAKFTGFLNFSLSQTLVRIFTGGYAFLVIIYTTLWVLSIKGGFTIPGMWAGLGGLLFGGVLIFVLSKFSLDAKKS